MYIYIYIYIIYEVALIERCQISSELAAAGGKIIRGISITFSFRRHRAKLRSYSVLVCTIYNVRKKQSCLHPPDEGILSQILPSRRFGCILFSFSTFHSEASRVIIIVVR